MTTGGRIVRLRAGADMDGRRIDRCLSGLPLSALPDMEPEGAAAADAAAEAAAAAPDGTDAEPGAAAVAPDGTDAEPEAAAAAPDGTDAEPEAAAAAPEDTSASWEDAEDADMESEDLPELSRAYLQKLIRDGNVLVDGRPVKASYPVRAGQELTLRLPEPKAPEIAAEPIPLSILYEDDDLLFVDKPKGMVVHPAAGHESGTLVNALLCHCAGSLSGINGVTRPGIVHRIDRDTTGVLVVCKNDAAHRCVAAQLKAHSITRRYRAICCGVPDEEQGTVCAPIGRSPSDRKKMAVCLQGGKHAVTHYRVLRRLRGFAYIECELETGRTHQIRVHMASIGHPLLGDAVYGAAQPRGVRLPALSGQTLHAMTLGLRHPSTGDYLEIEAPLPEYFTRLLTLLE